MPLTPGGCVDEDALPEGPAIHDRLVIGRAEAGLARSRLCGIDPWPKAGGQDELPDPRTIAIIRPARCAACIRRCGDGTP